VTGRGEMAFDWGEVTGDIKQYFKESVISKYAILFSTDRTLDYFAKTRRRCV